MARFYANENFPLPVVEELRRLGHDVLTTADSNRAGRAESDDAVLEFATSEDRAVLTLNRKHFVRLHQSAPQHSGIVVCSFDPDFVGLAIRIHDACQTLDSLSAQLLRVDRPGSKLGLV